MVYSITAVKFGVDIGSNDGICMFEIKMRMEWHSGSGSRLPDILYTDLFVPWHFIP